MEYAELAKKLDAAGCRTFWFGAADKEQVLALETLLRVLLPQQFAGFLSELGGGGVEGAEISGIDGVAEQEGFGTVWGDTRRLRETFGLADHLIVLRVDEEEYAWCLDCAQDSSGSAVALFLGADEKPSVVAPDFHSYFVEYVANQVDIEQKSQPNNPTPVT